MTHGCCTRRDTPGLIVGLALVAAGVLFTLDNLDVIEAGRLLDYWPVVLVAVGVAKLAQTDSWVGYAWGLALALAGAWLIGETLGIVRMSIWRLWPLVLVLVGASIVRRAFSPGDDPGRGAEPRASAATGDAGADDPSGDAAPARRSPADAAFRHVRVTDSRDPHVPMTAVMGAYERSTDTQDFRSASLTAIMGGCSLDLRRADIAGDRAVIDVLAIMGGIEIFVPENWVVESRVLPLMGGVEDSTRPDRTADTRLLVVKGTALMGGIEVKN